MDGHYWQRQGWDPNALDPMAVKDVLSAWREFLNEEEPTASTATASTTPASRTSSPTRSASLIYHETIGESALAKIPGFGED